jgi:hypothetical protein
MPKKEFIGFGEIERNISLFRGYFLEKIILGISILEL